MNLEDFNFVLPAELVAQYPLEKRSQSKLMVVYKDSGKIEHRQFNEIVDFFNAGDVIVLNDTKVVKARILAKRKSGGKVELLLFKEFQKGEIHAMVKGHIKNGETIELFGVDVKLTQFKEGIYKTNLDEENYEKVIERFGMMPLPPYIKREAGKIDEERYQTVFGYKKGAVAAPTAALHFDEDTIRLLKEKGVLILFITLHVGVGTFLPVKADDIKSHIMLPEYYEISKETADKINNSKRLGKQIIFCGTTTVRAVESATKNGILSAGAGLADIFIYPGYKFQLVERMLTNFHLPKSTPLFLVSALLGKERLFKAYEVAIKEKYRFFSYGDAMLIV